MDAPTAESLITFAETSRKGLTGFDSKSVLAELDRRHDDLIGALDWFIGAGRPDEALRLAGDLVPFWMATKRIDEGDAIFERALALPMGDPARRGRALYDHGYLIFWAGHYDRAGQLQRQAVELGRETNDPTTMALSLAGLARIALDSDLDEAKRLLREAIVITDCTGDRLGRSSAMHVLGVASQMSGDFEEAGRLMRERIELGREMGNQALIAIESANLSMVERQLGNLEHAEALALEALQIVSRRQDELQTAWMLNSVAAVTAAQGRDDRAAVLIGIADAVMDRAGGEWPPDERIQHDGTVASLTARLGSDVFEQRRASGKAMSTPDGVAFALAQPAEPAAAAAALPRST